MFSAFPGLHGNTPGSWVLFALLLSCIASLCVSGTLVSVSPSFDNPQYYSLAHPVSPLLPLATVFCMRPTASFQSIGQVVPAPLCLQNHLVGPCLALGLVSHHRPLKAAREGHTVRSPSSDHHTVQLKCFSQAQGYCKTKLRGDFLVLNEQQREKLPLCLWHYPQ